MRITGGILAFDREKAAELEGELTLRDPRVAALAALFGPAVFGGAGGLIGAVKAPSGHRLEGGRRGALAGLGTMLGGVGGEAIGRRSGESLGALSGAIGGGAARGLPGALSGAGAGMTMTGELGSAGGFGYGLVSGHRIANKLMGDPSWKRESRKDDVEKDEPGEKAAALVRTLLRR